MVRSAPIQAPRTDLLSPGNAVPKVPLRRSGPPLGAPLGFESFLCALLRIGGCERSEFPLKWKVWDYR
jgi:hypothetical protein